MKTKATFEKMENECQQVPMQSKVKNTNRTILLTGEINEESSANTVGRLLELQYLDPLQDITLIVESYGGDVYSCILLMNAMNMVSCDIRTIVMGKAMSAGAMIFVNGTHGKRFMAPHARLMLHQVSGGIIGTAKDIDIEIGEIKKLQDELVEILSDNCKLSINELKNITDRNVYLTVNDAITHGLCDKILTRIV